MLADDESVVSGVTPLTTVAAGAAVRGEEVWAEICGCARGSLV